MGITRFIIVTVIAVIVLGLLGFSLIMKIAMHDFIEAGFSIAVVVGGHLHMRMHKHANTAKRRHKQQDASEIPAHKDESNMSTKTLLNNSVKTKMPRFNKVEWSEEDAINEVERTLQIGGITVIQKHRNTKGRG